MRRRLLKGTLLVLLAVVAVAIAGGLWLRHTLRASLPQTDGSRVVSGLRAPVRIDRDGLGVPTITGASRIDVALALGFLHAQERFFQMDLLRRKAAGELAEIVGPAALPLDRETRVHRFRAAAQRIIASDSPDGQALIEAYTAGVNAGLAALGAKPVEYLALRVDPAPWKPEDTILAAHAMFIELHDPDGARESALGLLHELLPPALAAFLDPPGTEWDAPDVGEAFSVPPIPGPEVFDLRAAAERRVAFRESSGADEPDGDGMALGSNNWAVAGTHTTTGAAIVADDMHLGIAVPNTWYRASLAWPGADGAAEQRVTGATLPGVPNVVVGSTGKVAWGFTNTQGDWHDLVVIEVDPHDREVYRTPEGPRRFEHHKELLRVKGGRDQTFDVVSTIWGPVIDKDHHGRPRALRWTAYDREAVNSGLVRLETAKNVEDALRLAAQAGLPPQNFVCGDAQGHIGWTVIGRIPLRVGFDGQRPSSWADGTRRWEGWLAPADYPRIVDPPSGRIWSANSRVVDGAMLARIGEDAYDLGARQGQIKGALLSLEKAGIADMLRIQLDDRALFLTRWRDVILRALTPETLAGHPVRAEFRRQVEGWGGRASVDSVGYRLTRTFRLSLAEAVFGALTAGCKAADARFDYVKEVWRFEGPLWALVTSRPAHLLDPRYASWDEQLLAAVDDAAERLLKNGGTLAERTWGERNTTLVQHPLSRAVPALSRWLDMPRRALPGDSHMPRFQSPAAGASQRMAVSPGRESEGYFHMPVGQSGHPLSPHYGDGHAAWVEGRPTPFLPGPTAHTLTLTPR